MSDLDNTNLIPLAAQQPPSGPVDYGISLESYDDIERLRRIVAALYMILDDIDTMDDVAKENDALYRQGVFRLQQKKSVYMCSDGYNLFVKEEP